MLDLFVATVAGRNIIPVGNAATRNAAADERHNWFAGWQKKALKQLGAFRRSFGFPQHTPVKIV